MRSNISKLECMRMVEDENSFRLTESTEFSFGNYSSSESSLLVIYKSVVAAAPAKFRREQIVYSKR